MRASLSIQDDTWQVVGPVVHGNVMSIYKAGRDAYREFGKNSFTIDFSQMERHDSSSLALLIEWLRLAEADNKAFTCVNVPETLIKMIEVYGLSEIIPISE